MYQDYELAGKGLKTLFISEIITLIATFLVWIPLVGGLGVLVGLVMGLVGLHTASPAHPLFKKAFMATIASIVVSFLGGIVGEGNILQSMLNIVATVLGFLTVYYVCVAAGHLLSAKGDQATADSGTTVWKLNAICSVVGVVCGFFVLVPIISIVANLSLLGVAIASIVGGILYLIFLNRASQSLLG